MKTETLQLEQKGWVPNNPRLPVLIYRGAVEAEGKKAAETFETRFADHGWPPQWRGSVYDYDHYHSTTHEALGVFAGSATLRLGGPDGELVDVIAGDALVLPVGTGHSCAHASGDFAVVGAYPEGSEWDICTEAPSEEAFQRMRDLPPPARDPVTGGAVFPRTGEAP
ncbi:cupin [Sphingopyxis sp. PAMC25046]|uniref:cupin n=1 Tax=Sphingopyxis sp. PAMC25046 TaxID=2565556 RepID=UPI00109E1DAA|nr:cupin [Sphingopyxis sp. PAMC25046]QCB55715.1 cupin [Sphingopyxis sp. PAMC25046]